MSLLWAVPVVAAAAATLLVAARARAVEDVARDLAAEVAALRSLRAPLAGLRRSTAETDALVAAFGDAHGPAPDGEGDGESDAGDG
ncbi:MAG TPA: hypothetical protein VKB57_10065 [Acidimicrobiales bacterium]|nr:hypothetical protein [Acidimicrobiales bacterium]